jgi:hypothetical protein
MTITQLKAKPAEITPELRKVIAAAVREVLLGNQLLGPEEIVRYKDLSKYTGVGKTATDEILKAGLLRPGVPLNDSGRAIGWFKSWLAEYQRSLIAGAEARSVRRNAVSAAIQAAADAGRERKARATRRRGK